MKLIDLNRQGGIGANSLLLMIGDLNILVDCGLNPKTPGVGALPDLSLLRDIELDLIIEDSAAYLRRVYTDADYDIMTSSLHKLPDPTLGVQRLYWTRNIIPGAPWTNGSGYSNPELDRIMEAAAAEGDIAKRRDLVNRWQEIVQEDAPILDLVELTWTTVSTARFRKERAQGDGMFAGLEDAWLAPR